MRGAALAILAFFACSAAFPAEAASGAPATLGTGIEAVSLRSIAGWLKAQGTEGYLGAGVARALGLGGEPLKARQRGFRNASVLRIAQLLPDESVLFMVQDDDGQVAFYHSTPRAGLQRALVSIRGQGVLPLGGVEAESKFRAEVLYWEDKAANR
jgi:hypothetical protein